MEPHSPHDTLEDQIRECFGRVVYSHKTHEKCADILLTRLSYTKITQIVLSAITTAGFVSVIAGDSNVGAIFGAFVSVILLALNSYAKSVDLGQLAQKHRSTAADLWLIREKYLSLLTDLKSQSTETDAAIAKRDKLLLDLHEVYNAAPSTMNSAYEKAQKALKFKEDLTFRSSEIDAFLPESLKKDDERRTQ